MSKTDAIAMNITLDLYRTTFALYGAQNEAFDVEVGRF